MIAALPENYRIEKWKTGQLISQKEINKLPRHCIEMVLCYVKQIQYEDLSREAKYRFDALNACIESERKRCID